MPSEKPKPSSTAKAAPDKPKSSKTTELNDDELRTISGGMATGGAGAGAASCVSQT